MSITEEYMRQSVWRGWENYMDKLPICPTDVVLDLGCGTGNMSELLAGKALSVTSIDLNPEMITFADMHNRLSNVQYICGDLKQVGTLDLPLADGIWSSFTVAYFPDLVPVLSDWLRLLKPGGWIALVEIDDLFGHEPIPQHLRQQFKSFYERQRSRGYYDFEIGSRMRDCMVQAGLEIVFEGDMPDKELSFNGKAGGDVLQGWTDRWNRMLSLQDFLGADQWMQAKDLYMDTLSSDEHYSEAQVKFIIGRKKPDSTTTD